MTAAETASPPPNLDWPLLLALAAQRRGGHLPETACGLWLEGPHCLRQGDAEDPRALACWTGAGFTLATAAAAAPAAHALLELYLPLLAARADGGCILAHLGQSLDGQIATSSGDSCYVTGQANLVHMHRLRALCDAVIVGAGTIASDDPRLTTRLVAGPNPVRLVIDPTCRLDTSYQLFHDEEAPTLIACSSAVGDLAPAVPPADGPTRLRLPSRGDAIDLNALVAALAARGIKSLFIEGGGVTVTRWLESDLLDRLQIATAPLLIGAGRPGIRLPAAGRLQDCRRPPHRLYQMGEDLLWDFDLRGSDPPDAAAAPAVLRRLR